jgi:hypothetical protein
VLRPPVLQFQQAAAKQRNGICRFLRQDLGVEAARLGELAGTMGVGGNFQQSIDGRYGRSLDGATPADALQPWAPILSLPTKFGRTGMTTRLDKTLKREITVDGRPFIVALSPDGVKLTQKGKRIGQELRWVDLVSGDAALAVALKASIGRFAAGEAPKKATSEPRRTPKAPPKATTGRRARDGGVRDGRARGKRR